MRAHNQLLQRALLLDFAASAPTAAALILASRTLSGVFAIPSEYLFVAGVILVPWCCLVAFAASYERAPDALVWLIIGLNGLWSAGSALFIANPALSPSGVGTSLVILQAIAVVGFALLQYFGLRNARFLTSRSVI